MNPSNSKDRLVINIKHNLLGFLQQKSIASTKLVSTKSKEEYISSLREVLSQLLSEKSHEKEFS